MDSPGAGQIELEVTPNASAEGTEYLRFYNKWQLDSGIYRYQTFYDNYYKTVGSEMYAYLNLPTGAAQLDDYRYKYGCWANKRYFIFGTPNGKGYYSRANAPDVINTLSEINPK